MVSFLHVADWWREGHLLCHVNFAFFFLIPCALVHRQRFDETPLLSQQPAQPRPVSFIASRRHKLTLGVDWQGEIERAR
jgi:hypothetical protein